MLPTPVALIFGFVIGSIVNMSILQLGPMLIPLPDGVDVSTAEGLRLAIPQFQPRHFVSPFLAHALGTLAGSCVAARTAKTHQRLLAAIIGVLFLIGGVIMVMMVGGPLWYVAADLLIAYLPMSCLGARLARSGTTTASAGNATSDQESAQ